MYTHIHICTSTITERTRHPTLVRLAARKPQVSQPSECSICLFDMSPSHQSDKSFHEARLSA